MSKIVFLLDCLYLELKPAEQVWRRAVPSQSEASPFSAPGTKKRSMDENRDFHAFWQGLKAGLSLKFLIFLAPETMLKQGAYQILGP